MLFRSTQLSRDAAFTSPSTGNEFATTTVNWTGMPNDGTVWYWRVKAGNATGWSSYSSPWSFINGSSPVPPVTTHISPANGGTAAGTQVTLSWNASAGATKYVTQISRDAAFTSPSTGNEFATTTVNWTGMPNDGSVWYWRVKAGNTTGWSSYSSPWSFINGSSPVPPVTTLQNGVPVTGIAGATGNQKFYKITVPSGQSTLNIRIAGGTGDCDLYVRRGAQPTTSSYDYRSWLAGNNETVSVSTPASGDWFVMLNGYAAYAGVTLTASYTINNVGIQDPARNANHVDAPVQNDAAHRSLTTYAGVIDQFDVQYNPRYVKWWNANKLPPGYDTYCNFFVWDVTRAMGAEIPHWVNSYGQPFPDHSQNTGGHEVSATEMLTWLRTYGNSFGWTKISTASAAQSWANSGKPAIVIGTGGIGVDPANPQHTNLGHVAIVRPGTADSHLGPATAQAGETNYNNTHVYIGFYGNLLANYVEYWGHP